MRLVTGSYIALTVEMTKTTLLFQTENELSHYVTSYQANCESYDLNTLQLACTCNKDAIEIAILAFNATVLELEDQ